MKKLRDFISKNEKSLLVYAKVLGLTMALILVTCIGSEISTNFKKRSALSSFELIPKTSDKSFNYKSTSEFVEYEIKKGDSIRSIWKDRILGYTYKNALSLIINKNNLKGTKDIHVGKIILIPTRTDETCRIITIKPGDTLSFIADKYRNERNIGDMKKKLEAINGYSNVQKLEPGQKLLVP